MKLEEVHAAVNEAFGWCRVQARPDGSFTAELASFSLTFAAMQKLSEALGTKLIDLDYDSGSEGYSDLTPGWPGEITLIIRPAPNPDPIAIAGTQAVGSSTDGGDHG